MEIAVTGDCIFYVKDLLPKDLCRTVIENYERDTRRRPAARSAAAASRDRMTTSR